MTPMRAANGQSGTPRSLLRRCALGLWLCGIALIGVIEFRRFAFAGEGLSMTPVAWMWLAGSTLTGIIGITLLLRALRKR